MAWMFFRIIKIHVCNLDLLIKLENGLELLIHYYPVSKGWGTLHYFCLGNCYNTFLVEISIHFYLNSTWDFCNSRAIRNAPWEIYCLKLCHTNSEPRLVKYMIWDDMSTYSTKNSSVLIISIFPPRFYNNKKLNLEEHLRQWYSKSVHICLHSYQI